MTGWVVGEKAIILKTVDGGLTWIEQMSTMDPAKHLYGVHFVDAMTGWIVGEGGTILKTVDGGGL
jgi:photosystem II stability/assembly factor-like uncharacterized protein